MSLKRSEPEILDSSSCNCLALRQAARQVTQLYDRHLAGTGLRTTQYSILAKLGRLGALSINELSVLMVMDRTTTGRAILPLERDGLVAIRAGADKRTRLLALTPTGEKRLRQAMPRWQAAQEEFEAAFGDRESANLRATLAGVVVAAAGI